MLKYNKIKFIFGNNFTHLLKFNQFISSVTVTGATGKGANSTAIECTTTKSTTPKGVNTITTIKGDNTKNISTEYTGTVGPHTVTEKIRKDIIKYNEILRGIHYNEQNKDKFIPHPFNRRFAFTKLPLFPIEPRNLRIHGLLKKKKRGIGKKCNSKGIRHKHLKKRGNKPNNRTFEGGQTPLYKRLPKFKQSILQQNDKKYDVLNLCKLRYFIEKGRLDIRFPITQRHLYDSKCIKIKNGVHLFNVSRPDIKTVYELEKFRLMGCNVIYIKPFWLIQEENKLLQQFKELYQNVTNEEYDEIIKNYRYKLIQEQYNKHIPTPNPN